MQVFHVTVLKEIYACVGFDLVRSIVVIANLSKPYERPGRQDQTVYVRRGFKLECNNMPNHQLTTENCLEENTKH